MSQACHDADLPPQLCDDAILLVSELVTNVVLHGGSQARLSVQTSSDCVRVGVSDDSPVWPHMAEVDPLAERGRGLQLLETCATCWGVHDDDLGKTVWFELHSDVPGGGLRLVR